VPVISVGNITAGGTGKTPLVEWVLNALPEFLRGSAAVLSRGYGGEKDGNDETALLGENVPGLKQIVGANRVENAKKAVRKLQARLIILDDGFQHRKLARHLDIVAIDALVPFGYNRLVPRGLLREPLSALRRADAFVVTRSDRVDGAELEKIEARLRRRNPKAIIAHARHAPSKLLVGGEEKELSELKGKKVFAFCGIANPEGFRKTLESLGVETARFESLDDHETYPDAARKRLADAAEKSGVEMIVTTQKDAVKVRQHEWPIPFCELRIRMEMTKGEGELRALLLGIFGAEDRSGGKAGTSAEAKKP
jgi:tetraacyldisaccharide 4'-kinase